MTLHAGTCESLRTYLTYVTCQCWRSDEEAGSGLLSVSKVFLNCLRGKTNATHLVIIDMLAHIIQDVLAHFINITCVCTVNLQQCSQTLCLE